MGTRREGEIPRDLVPGGRYHGGGEIPGTPVRFLKLLR